MQFIIKIFITALLVALASEAGKRFSVIGAILASLPLTSLLAILWLYNDTRDPAKIISLSQGIFWAVLPSLLFFIVLPLLLKSGVKFGWAMLIATSVMFVGYTVYVFVLSKLGIKL